MIRSILIIKYYINKKIILNKRVEQIASRIDWLVLGGLIILAIIVIGYRLFPGSRRYSNGTRISYPTFRTIDESLEPYIRLEITKSGGFSSDGFSTNYYEGRVKWTGSFEDSVKSIENTHLVMYTRVERNQTFDKTIMLDIGLHLEISPNEINSPEDVLEYDQIVIPLLGKDKSSYDFYLSCSTNFND